MQAKDKSVFSGGGHHLGKPGHSMALRYELLLMELTHMPQGTEGITPGAADGAAPSKKEGVTHARISTCFQILDDLLPNLGVYQRVMKLLRDELHAAVYSHEVTSSKGGGGGTKRDLPTQRLPYFVIAQKLMSKRGSDSGKLKTEIASLKEQLYTCEADLEKASNTIESFRHDIKERDSKIHRLSSELRHCYSENERLLKLDSQYQRAQDRLKQEAEFKILSLRSTLERLKEDKRNLKIYKDTYETLQDAFSSTQSSNQHKQQASSIFTEKSELEQHIGSADLLKKQLLTIQNSLIKEYDAWTNSLALENEQSSQMLPAALIQTKKSFRFSIAEISAELSLLQDHGICLSKRHAMMKQQKTSLAHEALVLPAHPDNPLVPQQQITSKYAIMVYSSNDGGQSYYSLKEAQQCYSCGYQTVVCPHKAMNHDMIVQLPINSTHLKICRPALTVSKLATTSNINAQVDKEHQENIFKLEADVEETDSTKLLAQFRAKYPHYSSTVPRVLSADEVMNLTQQFYATLLNQDDQAVHSEEEQPPHLMECLFQFLKQRYQIDDIAPQVTFDFLSSLSMYHSQSKEMSVLSHMLLGQLDGCAFRYLLLLASLLDLMPWSSIKEVSPFLSILYPFLVEEDVEQLTMNFIAHSNNKISKQLVMDFFTWLVLQHKEPLILMVEGKLVEHPGSKPGVMLEVEFAEAISGLVPQVSDQLCRWLFLQSLSQYQKENESHRKTLPIKRLAFIGGYLMSLSTASSLKAELEQLLASITTLAQPATAGSVPLVKAGVTPTLITMEIIRRIAARMKAISLCK